jgi:hypothetical protein
MNHIIVYKVPPVAKKAAPKAAAKAEESSDDSDDEDEAANFTSSKFGIFESVKLFSKSKRT